MKTSTTNLISTATHCPYCGLQCAMKITRDDRAAVPARSATVEGRQFPTNRGGLCQKGWTSAELLRNPDRILTPLLRRGSRFESVSWEAALDYIAAGFQDAQRVNGADAVGMFGGGGLTNEKAYMLGKFTRVALGTSNIDYNGRWCMSSAAAAGIRSFGVDRGLPFPVTDLTGAKAILIFGGNVAETMPPFVGHLSAAANAGGLIVVDPRRTATAMRAEEGGGLHLQVQPGTDMALALGMAHIAITEGHIDRTYVDTRTKGYDEYWPEVAQWDPSRTERVTGVPVAQIRRAVEILAHAKRDEVGSFILTARGAEQHANGTDTVSAIIGLALLLGLPGNRGSGYGCITGQGNGQGGREHGQKADQLPGYRKINDPAARAHVAEVWGVDPDSLPGVGKSAYELLDSLGQPGGVKALMVHGSNIALSAPNAGHIVDRLRSLDMLVVCDFVMSETAAMADVVLPVLQWAEEEGTLTSLEGRVLRRRRAVAAPEGPRSELEVWQELAVRLNQPAHRFPTEPQVVFDELRRASKGGIADYSGVTYQRLDDGEAVHWPCPDTGEGNTPHPGTPRLFLDAFATSDGRAAFVSIAYGGQTEPLDNEFPLLAITGRVLAHYQSGAQTRRIRELSDAAGEMFVQAHPDTAERCGLRNGDLAQLVSRRGTTQARVHCDETMRLDTVFIPFHYPDAERANLITNPALDPTSRMPEFKVSAVRLENAT
ncbi:molybdopterin oxidoreductase family protein [Hoyosella rhizosphaerae]|uniref:Molybdopterin oxidoreductase n=1 Tax=Hoyosella rhizosphaerae TaxID=1755582 RepID=A0A916UAS2_9ACTN|nr:molybdopterin oxidoreductase family protein [Hoyosella rhizosphaerae]MBN4925964.1 molybdopterin oxidoreductase family protein [Hoyosella rhizosphaerae]GGC66601.1 molybdopterin oxidoreductase [Hoyosella rhizosphaerae]